MEKRPHEGTVEPMRWSRTPRPSPGSEVAPRRRSRRDHARSRIFAGTSQAQYRAAVRKPPSEDAG